jgi:Uncharacterized conserved protein
MVKVKNHFPVDSIDNIEEAVRETLGRDGTLNRIKADSSVAIATGSREIANITAIIRVLVKEIKKRGGSPFIVPAMGSHGGATADGQKEVLESFGITEENTGAPIKSSMETVELGLTGSGIPVYIDKNAFEADCIIPVGRIKPHTDFRGSYESGLMKMIAIGLGKQKGASVCHQLGLPDMSKNVHDIAKVSLKKANIIFGVGIIENAFHGTNKITAIPAESIEKEEPVLLLEAKSLVPSIPFKKVDVIVIDEMGKDISGTGMDSNVIGRSSTLGEWEPYVERIVALDLTDKSHHNANGVGLADIITYKLFNKIGFEETYPNTITCAETKAVKIPVVMPNDELAIKCGIKTCTGIPSEGVRLVRIKNTLSMREFYISEALVAEAVGNRQVEIIGEPERMIFDENHNLIWE